MWKFYSTTVIALWLGGELATHDVVAMGRTKTANSDAKEPIRTTTTQADDASIAVAVDGLNEKILKERHRLRSWAKFSIKSVDRLESYNHLKWLVDGTRTDSIESEPAPPVTHPFINQRERLLRKRSGYSRPGGALPPASGGGYAGSNADYVSDDAPSLGGDDENYGSDSGSGLNAQLAPSKGSRSSASTGGGSRTSLSSSAVRPSGYLSSAGAGASPGSNTQLSGQLRSVGGDTGGGSYSK